MGAKKTCDICGQNKKIRIPDIMIAFGMCGDHYNICYKCSKSLNIDQFFRKIAAKYHFSYPLKLKDDK